MVKKEKYTYYPEWIDEWSKSFYNAFVNMVPISWGPIDLVTILKYLNGTFINKLYYAVKKVKKKNIPLNTVSKAFPSPSSLRVALYWLALEYQFSDPKDKSKFREVIEYLVSILKILVKEDLFAYKSNIIHSSEEIKMILENTPWQKGNNKTARELGKLYTSLSSLVFLLYGDFFPQDSHEIYGPYDASLKFGKNTILTIKHFPKIKPVEIWPHIKDLEYSDIKIYQVYKNVKFICEVVGMHSIYEGDLLNNLIFWAVEVDNKFITDISRIKEMSSYFAELTLEHARIFRKISKEDIKQKTLELLCYQFVYFFKLAGIDWRPTLEMIESVKGRDIPERFEVSKVPSYEEYVNSPDFEVYWLKDLYK